MLVSRCQSVKWWPSVGSRARPTQSLPSWGTELSQQLCRAWSAAGARPGRRLVPAVTLAALDLQSLCFLSPSFYSTQKPVHRQVRI